MFQQRNLIKERKKKEGSIYQLYSQATSERFKGSFTFCFRYLLSLGADTEAENDCGEKPADLIDPDSKELLELFGVGGA